MKPVLVTGATSKAGGPLARRLVESGVAVRGGTRRPSALRAGVEGCGVVHLDFDEPATFGPALDGVGRVFLSAAPLDTRAAERLEPLVRGARERGVERLVLLSSMDADRDPESPLSALEQLVLDSSIPAVALRAGWYQENFAAGALAQTMRDEGRLRVPAGEGRASFVSAEDVAAVAARALEDDELEGTALTLTGPEALTHAEVAAHLSAAAGRPIHYETIDDELLLESPLVAGRTLGQARYLTRLFANLRSGVFAPVTTDVEDTLGRRARDLASFAREHAAVWR